MIDIKIVFCIFVTLLITGCATTSVSTYQVDGKSSLCEGKKRKNSLGEIAILPEAAWRHDQKEPRKREFMVLEEITRSFQDFPCGSFSILESVRTLSNWSSMPESELLARFSKEKIDTIIIIRIEEFTPRLAITFSLPFLWSGTNEVDFHVRAISVKSGSIIYDSRVKRVTGGPFNVRSAEWSRIEFNSALNEVIGNQKGQASRAKREMCEDKARLQPLPRKLRAGRMRC